MAGELQVDYVPGKTVYFILRNSVGQVWNTVGAAFEAYSTANIADYDIAATEQGTASGYYTADMPGASAGIYNILAKERLGGAPAEIDLSIGHGENFFWTGSAVGVVISAIANNAITAASIATGAIDADALATDAVNEIVAAVWAQAMTELGAVPGVTGTVLQALEWIFLLSRNRILQTATLQTLRNDADSGAIATSAISDDGTTFVRGEFS